MPNKTIVELMAENGLKRKKFDKWRRIFFQIIAPIHIIAIIIMLFIKSQECRCFVGDLVGYGILSAFWVYFNDLFSYHVFEDIWQELINENDRVSKALLPICLGGLTVSTILAVSIPAVAGTMFLLLILGGIVEAISSIFKLYQKGD